MILKLLIITAVAMLPVIELRGAIPIAAGLDLPEISALIAAMIGNLLPMPLIFMFAQTILHKGTESKIEWIQKVCNFFIHKGKKGGKKLQEKSERSVYLALLFFVGIPLPGTGAWTGTLAASFLDLDFKKSMIAVACGTLMAGLIMLAISFGVFDLLFQ